MRRAIAACRGLRLLRQVPWECLASFILSSTKRIVQIQEVVGLVSERYGTEVAVPPGDRRAFAFPAPERLAHLSEAELRACKMGFRAPYLHRTAEVTAGLTVDAAAIERAARLLAAGRVVAFPTATVYGLGADADNAEAVRAVFAAKGRPADHPVIVHVLGAEAIDAWASGAPEAARQLAHAFWPGPLTLVLPRSRPVHDALTGGQESVGLRCPAHPWARALLAAFAELRADPATALAAPSANGFGRISPTTAAHVGADLGEKPAGSVDMILDGGPCPVGIESTIVDLSGATPRLLRHGAITRRQVEQAIGRDVPDAGGDAPRASGRLKSPYVPRAPLEMLPATALPARLNALRGTRLAVLAPAAALLVVAPEAAVVANVPSAEVEPDDVLLYTAAYGVEVDVWAGRPAALKAPAVRAAAKRRPHRSRRRLTGAGTRSRS